MASSSMGDLGIAGLKAACARQQPICGTSGPCLPLLCLRCSEAKRWQQLLHRGQMGPGRQSLPAALASSHLCREVQLF